MLDIFLVEIDACFRLFPTDPADKASKKKIQKYCLDLVKYITRVSPSVELEKVEKFKHKMFSSLVRSKTLLQPQPPTASLKSLKALYPKVSTQGIKLLLLIVRNFLKVLFKGLRSTKTKCIKRSQVKEAYKVKLSGIYEVLYRKPTVGQKALSSIVSQDVAILRKQGIKLLKYKNLHWVPL